MNQPYLADTHPHADATLLIEHYGAKAWCEAAERADRSRRAGNHLNFCRWRQVGRLLEAMAAQAATGTIH